MMAFLGDSWNEIVFAFINYHQNHHKVARKKTSYHHSGTSIGSGVSLLWSDLALEPTSKAHGHIFFLKKFPSL